MQAIYDLIESLRFRDSEDGKVKTLGDAVMMVDGNLTSILAQLDEIACGLCRIADSLEKLVEQRSER